MKAFLQRLYADDDPIGRWFRKILFVFDVVTVAYFFLTATARLDDSLLAIDLAIGAIILADVIARLWIAEHRLRFLLRLTTVADLIVLGSLLVPFFVGSNLGFLRVLRLLRLVSTLHLVGLTRGVKVNSRIVVAVANLAAFVFVVTSFVWVWEHDRDEATISYVDALYFTVTTLTTTGYGDITLTGRGGRLLTVGIMVFGVGLFLKLLQAIYQPVKIEQPCSDCGLRLHDPDATYCKHCGGVIYIEKKGNV